MATVTEYSDNHKILDGVEHKLCKDCLEWLPMNQQYFYKNKSNHIDGFNPYCKECAKRRSSDWNKNNKEKYLDYLREYNKQYYKDNKEEFIEKANRQRRDGKYRDWQRRNKDIVKKYRLYRQMHKTHDITKEQWVSCKEYFNNCCAYCGLPETEAKEKYNNYLHKDHVDHGGANDLANCVPACKSCNSRKGTQDLSDWYNNENSNYVEGRLKKILDWLDADYKEHITD